MDYIKVRNVCHAYLHGLQYLQSFGVWEDTRNGRALVLPTPMVTCTSRPTERVLFDERRDANPFFHLMESIWMLAGSDDGRWLDQFISDFSERYAEPSGRVHGAYGARWRDWFAVNANITERQEQGFPELEYPEQVHTIDQLEVVVRLLRENPSDRQAVIQMWDAGRDLGWQGLRDRPCNTQIYLRVRNGDGDLRVLDLTVTCRSNDAIWGAHGANAVHFSVLQEYLAAAIGVGVGVMYQFSNNYHVYEGVLEKKWTDDMRVLDPYTQSSAMGMRLRPQPMVTVPSQFLEDAERFVQHSAEIENVVFANPWFAETARPMLLAARHFRAGSKSEALALANTVRAEDWSWAARRWISRRMDNV